MAFSIQVPRDAPLVQINACKYDGAIHRTWSCQLIDETDDYWIFYGVFENEINHPLLGLIRPNTISLEFYWKNRWYNVFRFFEPDGSFRNFYCNINMPPVFDGQTLTYVDLEIDVLVQPDLSYQILDLDEFEELAQFYKYSEQIIEKTQQTLKEIINLVESKKFPFDSPQSMTSNDY